ncbi:MAG: YHYH protein [Solirubrobacterales bacterium]
MSLRRRLLTFAPFGAIAAVLAATFAIAGGGSAGSAGAAGILRSVDRTSLPIGDGKVTYSGPREGYVYACQNPGGPGGGAQVEGPWIKEDGTFDKTAKPTVDGSVSWGSARRKIWISKKKRVIEGNGLPVGNATGEYPVSPSDDAFRYDRNPNSVGSRSVKVSLSRHPKRAKQASCVPMGVIGYAKNGVALFNALDALDRDAVAHEVQDRCEGHPQKESVYHYHSIPDCLTKKESKQKASGLVGYALDGFPIYGPRGNSGRILTNDDLDACHGKVGKVYFEGRWQRIYHYVSTYEYPYTVGCFRGTPVTDFSGR